MIEINTWGPSTPSARFMKDGFRFVVRPTNVLVYERPKGTNTDYSLNVSAYEDRVSYDSRRYQIRKNKTVIDALQTVMNS